MTWINLIYPEVFPRQSLADNLIQIQIQITSLPATSG